MRASYLLDSVRLGIIRNRNGFLLSAAVLGVCLMVLSLFALLTVNVVALVRAAGRQAEIDVFLLEPAAGSRLTERIGLIEGVTGTRFVSKEEALAELATELGEDTALLSALGDNPLPASVRVTIHPDYASADRLGEIEQKIALLPGVAEVWSGKEMIDRLNRITRTAVAVDIMMLVVVSIAVAFIVFQTVDSSIVARRHEIAVMELVGAERMTVRLPFVIEGAVQGLAGGVTSVVLVFVFYRLVAAVVAVPLFPLALVLGVNLGLGTLLGLLGAALALGRIQQLPQPKIQSSRPKSQAGS